MKKLTVATLIVLLFSICLSACDNTKKVSATEKPIFSEDRIKGPQFSVKVWLSKKAKKEMLKQQETLIISSMFDGDGEVLPNVKSAPFRDVYLGDFKKEIQPNEVAYYNSITFSKADIQRLSGSYGLLINVTSGRKSSNNNLLSCAAPYYDVDYLLEDPKSILITISCDLIGDNKAYNPAYITNSKNPDTNIKQNQVVISPLDVIIDSQGLWSGFEGEIGVAHLIDKTGKDLGYTILSAMEEWMRAGNVRYGGTLKFNADVESIGVGTLRIFNNNPSKIEGVQRYLDIPVQIRK